MKKTVESKRLITQLNRIVVKISSSVVKGPDGDKHLTRIAQDIAKLKINFDLDVIIVASGAIALGKKLYKPVNEAKESYLKAAASLGQVQLMNIYSGCFQKKGLKAAQFLVTRKSFSDKSRYDLLLNLEALLDDRKAIPIFNENDPIVPGSNLAHAKKENDMLAAIIALNVDADLLIFMSEVEGLYTNYGSEDQELIYSVDGSDHLELLSPNMVSKNIRSNGKGGIDAKLKATRFALYNGIHACITSGFVEEPLQFLNGIERGTFCRSEKYELRLQRRERANKEVNLKSCLQSKNPKGWVVVDNGARNALLNTKSSLLDVGIKEVSEQHFDKGDIIAIRDTHGIEIAKGITALDGGAILKQVRKKQVGAKRKAEVVIDRHNMIFL